MSVRFSVGVGFCNALLLCLLGLCSLQLGCRSEKTEAKPLPLSDEINGSDSLAQMDAATPKLELPMGSAQEQKVETRFHFLESSKQLGVDFTYRNGEESDQYAIIENLGGGVAIFDYDQDGKADLLFSGGGQISADGKIEGLPHKFYRNLGAYFVDGFELAQSGIEPRYGHGLLVWDQDNDGFSDVLTTGYGGASLCRNMGDGTFQRVPSDSLSKVTGIVTSACSGDFSGDGLPDLFISTYVDWSFQNHIYCPAPSGTSRELCSPKEFQGTRDYLFIAESNGKLRSVEAEWLKRNGKGLGALACDFDHDGDVDIYVANDTTENFLYTNVTEAQSPLGFNETAILGGVALDERGLPNGSMGLAVGDVNNDLQTDIWVANYERESFALYRNEGAGSFLHTSRRYGIAALGGLYVGFGTDWEDFDNDGREEIVISNGHVLRYPTGAPRQQHPLFLVRDGERFVVQQFPQESYFAGRYDGRGLACGDFDRDGRPDIAISHINHPVAILMNETATRGNHLNVRLVGTHSSRDAVGAHLVLTTSQGKSLRSIVGGGSYLSHNERLAHFGFPNEAKLESLEIQWPSGINQTITDLDFGEMLVVEPR